MATCICVSPRVRQPVNKLLIQPAVLGADAGQVEALHNAPSRCHAQALPPRGADAYHVAPRVRQRRRIARRHDRTGLSDDRSRIADVRRDARNTCGHRLPEDVRKRFAPRGAASDVHGCRQAGHVVAFAEKHHLVRQSVSVAERGQLRIRLVDAATGQHESHTVLVGGQLGGGPQEGSVVLDRMIAPEQPYHDFLVPDAEFSTHGTPAASRRLEYPAVEAIGYYQRT